MYEESGAHSQLTAAERAYTAGFADHFKKLLLLSGYIVFTAMMALYAPVSLR